MPEVTTCQEGRNWSLLVRFEEPQWALPLDYVSDRTLINLAFRQVSGSSLGPPKHVGANTTFAGHAEDTTDHFACVAVPSVDNVAALLATGFPWDTGAARIASGFAIPPERIAEIRKGIDSDRDRILLLRNELRDKIRAGAGPDELSRLARSLSDLGDE
jgi:hypothetical protein